MNTSKDLTNKLDKMITASIRIGIASIIAIAIIAVSSPVQFYKSYLTSYIFFIGLTLGAFPFILIHHLVKGEWGWPIRRILEIMTKNIWLMAILFIPIIFGMKTLFHWTNLDHVAHDHILLHKQPYLNEPFFFARAVFYFLVWGTLSFFLNKFSLLQDKTPHHKYHTILHGLGGAGLFFFSITATFASVDWVMSIEPHWFSTIYGMLLMVSFAITALTFSIITVLNKKDFKPFSSILNKGRIRDFALLMFATGLLWAYISVSQFIIIWNGNLQEEAPWYNIRFDGGWHWLILIVIALQLILPFLAFMFSKVKQSGVWVMRIAFIILCTRFIEAYWLIQPAFFDQFHVSWLDILIPIAMGSVWIFIFCRNLMNSQLTLEQDPILQKH